MASNASRAENENEDEDVQRMVAAALLEGGSDAYGNLVTKYQDTIALQMRRFSRNELAVEQLVHDVFVEAYLSLGSYKRRSPFLHWLRKIAVRVGYRYWKQQEKNRALSSVASHEAIDRVLSESVGSALEASELLGDLLDLLNPRDRLVLTLLYWDGCTIPEAAELSGWSQSMVKVQAHRARKRLKKLIEESR